jgi:hypothetical protein
VGQRGERISKIASPSDLAGDSRCLVPSLRCISCTLRPFDELVGTGTYGQKKTVLDPQRAFGTLNCFCGVVGQLLMYN